MVRGRGISRSQGGSREHPSYARGATSSDGIPSPSTDSNQVAATPLDDNSNVDGESDAINLTLNRAHIDVINGSLNPSGPCARRFRKIFEERLDAAGSCWKKVSSETKNFYFEEFRVAERALFLWNNDHIENLIRQNRKVILPIIFPALERNTRGHWNQAVISLTLNVRKIFSDQDPELFEDCLHKFDEGEAKEKEVRNKRDATWKRLEEIAASKAVTNGTVLLPHSAAHQPSSR